MACTGRKKIMLFEQRTYTLKPGILETFWQAQHDRGFEIMSPILERLIGYFSTASGADQQLVHCYRYDSFDDWMTRLHGLAKVPQLGDYFKKVRPMLLAQETKFMALSPVKGLNPIWGNGDWLPAKGAHPGLPSSTAQVIVEESTIKLNPGTLPAYWEAWEKTGLSAGDDAVSGMLACFNTLVGRQHEVVMYRWFASFDARQQKREALRGNPQWKNFVDSISASVQSHDVKLMTPAQIPVLSPLFTGAPIKD